MKLRIHQYQINTSVIRKKMNDNTEIMNIRLPKQVLDWIDQLVKSGLYTNRSEAIRDCLHEYLEENRLRKR